MKAALITCTSHRPLSFGFLLRSMLEQDYEREVLWIVAEDGNNYSHTANLLKCKGWEVKIINLEDMREGISFSRNLLAAITELEKRKNDVNKVLFIEDDDYYKKSYISRMLKELDEFDAVGLSNVIYYHVKGYYSQLSNSFHSSLCSTAIRISLLDKVKEAMKEEKFFIDLKLWEILRKENLNIKMINEPLCVGMKGWPGKHGIGRGHSILWNYDKDFDYSKLSYGLNFKKEVSYD